LVDVGHFAEAVKAKQGATTNTLNHHRTEIPNVL